MYKEIAKFLVNEIKTLIGSEFSKQIHMPDYNQDHAKFTVDDISNVEESAWKKILDLNKTLFENKLLMAASKYKDAIEKFEEDNRYIEAEDLPDLRYVLVACGAVKGKVRCVVEDLVGEDEKLAYEKNDLFENNVYCEVITEC